MRLLAVLAMSCALAASAWGGAFSDVPRTHWAYDAIEKTVAAGILQGYDGTFNGNRLLNRYQMAVITAKLLDSVRAGDPVAVPVNKGMIGNLEALTIEFADELARLGVKVSALEDALAALQEGTSRRPVTGRSPGDVGFTAFASFALVKTDGLDADGDGNPGNNGGRTRYWDTPDTKFFTMPQVSTGVDTQAAPGVAFHLQVDYMSDINDTWAGGTYINEAYFVVDEFFGDVGAKMGGFALPVSMEHDGPFRSCNLTITPSAVNYAVERTRVYGLELQKTKDVRPGDVTWRFAVVSGSDLSLFAPRMMDDYPVGFDSAAEINDRFSWYVQVARKPSAINGFGWNLTYMNNDGNDYQGFFPTGLALDASFFNVGVEWSRGDYRILAQYLTSSFAIPTIVDLDSKGYYVLLNYRIAARQSVTLRYDGWTLDTGVGIGLLGEDGSHAVTFAYNRRVTDATMLQFEYVTVTTDTTSGAINEDDDLWQIRYKVHF